MSYFTLVKEVLDKTDPEIPASGSDKDAASRSRYDYLGEKYKDTAKSGCLDHSSVEHRFAYIFKYAAAHAFFVHDHICNTVELQELFNREKFHLCCIGSGPGTDLVGVVKYCQTTRKSPEITCHLLDRVPEWEKSWNHIKSSLSSPPSVIAHFQTLDMTWPAEQWNLDAYKNADLFTFSYSMSEAEQKISETEPFFDALFSNAKPNAKFLFIDNPTESFAIWMCACKKQYAKYGLRLLKEVNCPVKMPAKETKYTPVLKPYIDRMSDACKRMPMCGALVGYRLLTKDCPS